MLKPFAKVGLMFWNGQRARSYSHRLNFESSNFDEQRILEKLGWTPVDTLTWCMQLCCQDANCARLKSSFPGRLDPSSE